MSRYLNKTDEAIQEAKELAQGVYLRFCLLPLPFFFFNFFIIFIVLIYSLRDGLGLFVIDLGS